MSTRSKARASAANSAVKPASVKNGKQVAKSETSPPPRAKALSAKVASKRGKGKGALTVEVDEGCTTCSKENDGSPMVVCYQCKKWNHFVCVDLSERDAEELKLFVCPPCSEATGFRSTMSWEGLDAFEEIGSAQPVKPQPRSKSRTKTPVQQPKPEPSDASVASASEDEYVMDADDQPPKDRGRNTKKRRVAAAQDSDSETDSTMGANRRKRTRRFTKASASPPASRHQDIKRKASMSEARATAKKQKSAASGAAGDPTRKYCLTKLEEMFKDIFFRYPHVRTEGAAGGPPEIVPKSLDDMTEEEKEALLQESKTFADEVEKCIYEISTEPDKTMDNYKDRYRTLQSNLSKPNRVVIHQRITSATITPKELSGMSPTELADEETKQEIKQAEQEALEHSILQKVVAPRAKITHKGLQDIEYNDEPMSFAAPSNAAQEQKEAEAEERRERERLARLKPAQRQRTMSVSVASEATSVPATPTNDSWGAPPPVPVREGQASPSLRHSTTPLFIRTAMDTAQDASAPEMNLGDLINMEQVSPTAEANGQTAADAGQISRSSSSSAPPTDLTTPSPTAIISPFGFPKTTKQSFSIDTLWTSSKDQQEEEDHPHAMSSTPPPLSPPTMKDDEFEGEDMVESPIEPDEQDFDMFLEDKEAASDKAPKAPPLPVPVEDLPQVWSGKLALPLDSTIPQESGIIARQIAGTTLLPESLLWKTLFPSDTLRIDGRVDVSRSAAYITQNRMNSAKELYAVVLSPASEADEHAFKAQSDHLIQKGRHGLVFPWGPHSKEHHPGKELYIIPLTANEPVPDYIELLDNLKLPKDRTRSYMVGIWILNRGKLAPPPPPPVPAPAPAQIPPIPLPTFQPTPLNPVLSSISNTPTHVQSYTPPVGLPPHIPSISPPTIPTPTAVPTIPVPPAPVPAPPVDPAVLAAEVASLTPEQIQNLLRTLNPAAIPGLVPPAAPPAQALYPGAPPPPGPPPLSAHLPNAYVPPYMPGAPPTPPVRAPPPPPPAHAMPWQNPVQPPYHGAPEPYAPQAASHAPYGAPPPPSRQRHDDAGRYDRDRGGYHGDRDRDGYGGGRGGRGQGRGRGRGRGRGGGGGDHGAGHLPPPVDSGWPRKPKRNNQPYDDRNW